ncbi:unnamed protein product [Brassica rapa subsp. narinosa]
MGLAPLCYQAQVLYPDLVRQLLATAQITYQNPTAPTYENCYFSFMADEHLCVDPRAPIPDENAAGDDVEDITPPADGAYDLEDLTDVTDDHAYRRWMVDSQKKNNSLMKRILRALTGGCIRSQVERTTQGTRRPGKEPAGTSAREERLPRNRRTAGHSSSGDSD